MAHQESFSRKLFIGINTIILTLAALIAIVPVIHVIMASFLDPVKLAQTYGLILWPTKFSLAGYAAVFSTAKIWTGYLNSIFYVSCAVTLGTLLTLFGAYVTSRKGLFWNRPIMFFISFTMIFNGGMIPTYLLVSSLGWIDSPLAVIVPLCMNAFNMIIMRTFFQGIPESLEESANLDGAGRFRILFQIMIPLAKASIAVIALFYMVFQWNSFFQAMIYLQSQAKYPLQLVLRMILIENQATAASSGSDSGANRLLAESVKYGTIMVSILPMLAAYPFIQKYFVGGVMIGAIKG
jgi:putative aldouronate transport system permease protein